MQSINLETFIQIHSKLIQPRNHISHSKFSSVDALKKSIIKPLEKNQSISFHEQNPSKSNNSLKLPSLYSNNLKYFFKEASVKEMKKKDYSCRVLNNENPAHLLY